MTMTTPEALPPPDLASKTVNDACWALIEALPEPLPGKNWNALKPAFYAALKVVHERYYAALAAPQWQPISTAPKDGTAIILTNGVTVAPGNWVHQPPYIKERRDLDGRYIDQDEFEGFDGWIDFEGGMNPEPTHWQPLPQPPKD